MGLNDRIHTVTSDFVRFFSRLRADYLETQARAMVPIAGVVDCPRCHGMGAWIELHPLEQIGDVLVCKDRVVKCDCVYINPTVVSG